MAHELLLGIRERKQLLPEVNRLAIEKKVPAILRNFSEIKGRSFTRNMIYRQVNSKDYPRPSFLDQLFDFYSAVRFASPESGRMITTEVASWDEWSDSLVPAEFRAAPRDLWLLEEQIESILARLRSAMRMDDTERMALLLLQLRAKTNEMIRGLEIDSANSERRGVDILSRSEGEGRGVQPPLI